MEVKICQSCGMPLTKEEDFGRNADGSKNEEYCCYCYNDGAFLKEETMEEMAEECVPFMLQEGLYKDAKSAKAGMLEYLPTLKRWKKNA